MHSAGRRNVYFQRRKAYRHLPGAQRGNEVLYGNGGEIRHARAEASASNAGTPDGGRRRTDRGNRTDLRGFAALREENAEIVGWLYCEGTEINYPVLHAENNDKYLRALPDGSYNYFGSLFMDYRNREDLTDENTLIYGHNMESSNQMFGGLSAFLEQAYADSHPYLYYLTPHGDYRVDVFAAYETTDSSEAYQRIFGSEEEYRSFLTLLEERSAIDMEIRPVTENRILTLSTCTNRSSNGRYVLHGVLRPLFDAEKNTGNGR